MEKEKITLDEVCKKIEALQADFEEYTHTINELAQRGDVHDLYEYQCMRMYMDAVRNMSRELGDYALWSLRRVDGDRKYLPARGINERTRAKAD